MGELSEQRPLTYEDPPSARRIVLTGLPAGEYDEATIGEIDGFLRRRQESESEVIREVRLHTSADLERHKGRLAIELVVYGDTRLQHYQANRLREFISKGTRARPHDLSLYLEN